MITTGSKCSSVVTESYHTPFLPVKRGVLHGHCQRPLTCIFNMLINTFIKLNLNLLNAFTAWCALARMSIRVDKCKTFGMSKVNSTSVQIYTQSCILISKCYQSCNITKASNILEEILAMQWTIPIINTDCSRKPKEYWKRSIYLLPLHPR